MARLADVVLGVMLLAAGFVIFQASRVVSIILIVIAIACLMHRPKPSNTDWGREKQRRR